MRRVKVFQSFDQWLNRFTNALLAVHRGVWLGLLDRPALQESTKAYYLTSAKYYDSDYNLSGLLIWEAWALSRFFWDCQSILVAAAGGGREVIALAKRDFHVEAFECSEELVRASLRLFANQNVNSKLILAAPDQVPLGLGVYDGIVVGWAAYMHISGRDRRVGFLQQLRLHCHPGSPILLSFFTRVPQSQRYRLCFEIAHTLRKMRHSTESVELGDNLDPTFVHHFTQAEIADELAKGGFELVYFAEQPYGHAIGRAV